MPSVAPFHGELHLMLAVMLLPPLPALLIAFVPHATMLILLFGLDNKKG